MVKRGGSHKTAGRWIVKLARLGYATKGVIYLLVGMLTLRAAWGAGRADGEAGAIREIGQQPFGQILLALTAVGLAAYVVWRIGQAWFDPDQTGNGLLDLLRRSGYGISAVAHLALALLAARAALGGVVDSSNRSRREWTAWVMSFPFGRWLIVAVGLGIVGVGFFHFYRAYSARFMREYNEAELDQLRRRWIRRIGRIGMAARGVAFCLIGTFLVIAGVRISPDQAKGLGEALDALARQPFGPWWLAAVGLGLIAFGLYCFSRARYRYFAAMHSQ